MKLAWGMVYKPPSSVGLLGVKYHCGDSIIPQVQKGANCSNTWRGINSDWKDMLRGVQWSVGKGNHVRFWSNAWLPSVIILKDFLPPDLSQGLITGYSPARQYCVDN